MRQRVVFSDEEMIVAINQAFASGADKDTFADKLQPPNLLAFFNNLPRPERDRLYTAAAPKAGNGE
ncbi:MAG TPA: hypothetical protein PLD59_14125 [Tepidisphaeraceae bacterium]|nr:hypothetical protein [Tepidisphaeraceae bacterium]